MMLHLDGEHEQESLDDITARLMFRHARHQGLGLAGQFWNFRSCQALHFSIQLSDTSGLNRNGQRSWRKEGVYVFILSCEYADPSSSEAISGVGALLEAQGQDKESETIAGIGGRF